MLHQKFSPPTLIFLLVGLLFAPNIFADSAPLVVKPHKSSILGTAKSCGNDKCHKRIYKEWKGSMHSRSTPQKDNLVKAFYDYLANEKFDTKKCDLCHAPIRTIFQEEGVENEIFVDGVTCVFCHSIYGMTSPDKMGVDYYRLNLVKFGTGPTKQSATNTPHKTKYVDMFKNIDICLGCHRKGEGAHLMKTEKKNIICQTCHMPSKQNLRSAAMGEVKKKVFRHLFEGGHSQEILEMSAFIMGQARKKEGRILLDVELENASYHTIPTGFPLRQIFMKITGYNESHKEVWTNFPGGDFEKDPQAYYGLTFKEEDELYAHYVKEVSPIKEHLLPANASTTFHYEVPSDNIKYFKIQLFYRLLPKRVIKKLSLEKLNIEDVLMAEENVRVR